jgi:hypothetical protein
VQASRSTVQQLLLARGDQAYWLAPSVTSGAQGVLGPAYTGTPISLAFQVKVAGPIVVGSMELCSCVYWEAGLAVK